MGSGLCSLCEATEVIESEEELEVALATPPASTSPARVTGVSPISPNPRGSPKTPGHIFYAPTGLRHQPPEAPIS